MQKTGYIAFITETTSTQDANGDWISGTKTTSDFVACNLQVITKQYTMLVDGQVKQASYSMYVDNSNVSVDMNLVSEISIKDTLGNSLGEHQIMNYEPLSISKQIKIVV